MRTWVHEDGAPTRECLCWEAYHGDLGGSSGWICIVERNTVGIWGEWDIDLRREIVEDIREQCTLRGGWSLCARLPLDGTVRRLAGLKVRLRVEGRCVGEGDSECSAREYCKHAGAYRYGPRRRCSPCRRRRNR